METVVASLFMTRPPHLLDRQRAAVELLQKMTADAR